jgi:hypothetical protein
VRANAPLAPNSELVRRPEASNVLWETRNGVALPETAAASAIVSIEITMSAPNRTTCLS